MTAGIRGKLYGFFATTAPGEIRLKDDMHLLALVMTDPVVRSQSANHTRITFEQRGANQAKAIKDWFYPGDNTGREFIYPSSTVPNPAPR